MNRPVPQRMGTGPVKLKTGAYPRTITFSSASLKAGRKRGGRKRG